MTPPGERGLTLVELIVAIAIVGLLAAAAAALLSAGIEAHAYGNERSALYREGLLALERMTAGVRSCTFLLVPNAHGTSRDILAFSGTVNDDGDFYFGDPLFPRIDEDPDQDMTDDNKAGIEDYDDDNDGTVDEGSGGQDDDDEDGVAGEDAYDGQDDDDDGIIDEDADDDLTGDGAPGITHIDDDGDGTVDEGAVDDNDEDGTAGEDPLNAVVFEFDGINSLKEKHTWDGAEVTLSQHVAAFSVTFEPADATRDPQVQIALTLVDDDGATFAFEEYVYPRNIVQKCGKRVR